jgi:hypothetical protein
VAGDIAWESQLEMKMPEEDLVSLTAAEVDQLRWHHVSGLPSETGSAESFAGRWWKSEDEHDFFIELRGVDPFTPLPHFPFIPAVCNNKNISSLLISFASVRPFFSHAFAVPR